MTAQDKFIWINASPSFKQFHRRLLNYLAQGFELEFWEYHNNLDEASTIEGAIELLRAYLRDVDGSIHLIGHGVGGAIALGYTRLYPAQIGSLTLLSVGVQSGITWHSYYYQYLHSLPCDREQVLLSMARQLFPHNCTSYIKCVAARLAQDLVESPSNHSLLRLTSFSVGVISVPLLVCGAADDPVIHPTVLQGWHNYLKTEDRLFTHPEGSHFFHHFFPESVGQEILSFWGSFARSMSVITF
jgi:pimeloyl-ACP methyl ester carboxylesterase